MDVSEEFDNNSSDTPRPTHSIINEPLLNPTQDAEKKTG